MKGLKKQGEVEGPFSSFKQSRWVLSLTIYHLLVTCLFRTKYASSSLDKFSKLGEIKNIWKNLQAPHTEKEAATWKLLNKYVNLFCVLMSGGGRDININQSVSQTEGWHLIFIIREILGDNCEHCLAQQNPFHTTQGGGLGTAWTQPLLSTQDILSPILTTLIALIIIDNGW